MRHHLLRLEGALLTHAGLYQKFLVDEQLQLIIHHLLLLHLK